MIPQYIRTAIWSCALGFVALLGSAEAKEHFAADVAEFEAATKAAVGGDVIVLRNGAWRDAELKFHRTDASPGPIVLRAETPGGVVFTGKSRLRFGGEAVHVAGFHWKEITTKGDVVEFRVDSKKLAHRCELRDCAVTGDDADGGERKWVSLYGAENAVRNCRFSDKRSGGTLLVVWLAADGGSGRHVIAENFFGPREKLGKNGGEILRIGDSKTSHLVAETMVRKNFFYRCDGEAEIVSNKSCGNRYERNTFVGSSGALTLRHGNECTVVGNAFFGDGRKGTGGVRVIGADHTVEGNLFYELTGDEARAALSLMNGLPDSPANGYFQVRRAAVRNNLFVRCKQNILVGLTDEDVRNHNLAPTECRFAGNVVLCGKSPVFELRTKAAFGRHERNYYRGELDWTLAPLAIGAWTETKQSFEVAPDGAFRLPDAARANEPPTVTTIADVGPSWLRPGNEFMPEVLRRRDPASPRGTK